MAATKSADAIKKVLDGPAMLAPSGMKNNFVNPSNLETELYIDLAICLTVSFLAVGMRLWTKARLIQKVEIEDCKINPLFLIKNLGLMRSRGLPICTCMNELSAFVISPK